MLKKKLKLDIVPVRTEGQVQRVRALFLAYARSLKFDLCFQDFEKELAELPGKYAAPEGEMFLAMVAGAPAGCIALRSLGDDVCEMKRLYVEPTFRGERIGDRLVTSLIQAARELGYKKMRLDTVPSSMAKAVKMYRGFGFREIPAYTANPVPGATFFELTL